MVHIGSPLEHSIKFLSYLKQLCYCNLPGKNTIKPSSLGTESLIEGAGLDGAISRSVSRSPSSSLPPSMMAKKSSALTKLPADPIKA